MAQPIYRSSLVGKSVPTDMKTALNRFHVSTTWTEGMMSETEFQPCLIDGHYQQAPSYTLHSDEPHALAGSGIYPNPQELLIAAFNACMTATFLTEAAKLGLILTQFHIKTSGEFAFTSNEPRSPHSAEEAIRYVITLSGSGSVKQFDRVHQAVIAQSLNRWALAGSCLIEGDLMVLPDDKHL